MTWIDKKNWLKDRYAEVTDIADVYQLPKAADALKNQLQTQIEQNEVVQVLGQVPEFLLVKKFDGTLGWISEKNCNDIEVGQVSYCFNESCTIDSFFKKWQSTPYLWGGVTASGIDCSGFVQRYFLEVYSRIIPKNSFDQRKLGISVAVDDIQNADLVFTTTAKGNHHVGIVHLQHIWHSNTDDGVSPLSISEFVTRYSIEDVRRIINPNNFEFGNE